MYFGIIYPTIANLFKNDSKNRDAISTRLIFQSEFRIYWQEFVIWYVFLFQTTSKEFKKGCVNCIIYMFRDYSQHTLSKSLSQQLQQHYLYINKDPGRSARFLDKDKWQTKQKQIEINFMGYTWTWIGLKIEIGWLFHFPAQSAENCSSKKIHYYWSASSFFITMKLSPLLSQKRTVLLLLLFLFAIERLSLPPERGHNFIVIPGRFSHNTKSADAIFCLLTSMDDVFKTVKNWRHEWKSK